MRLTTVLLSFLAVAWTPLPKSVSPEIHLAAPAPLNNNYAYMSDVAASNDGFFVASTEYALHLYGMAFDERGERRHGQTVGIAARAGWLTAVASSGRQYLVVWDDYNAIRGLRYTSEGQRIDREPLVIRPYVSSATVLPPKGAELDVAWNGTHYVVVSEVQPRQFVATVIGEDGVVVQNDIPVSGNRIATRNGVFVIVNHSDWEPRDLVVQTVMPDGEVQSGTTLANGATQAEIAAGADGFYVIYRRGEQLRARKLDVLGAPVGEEEVIAEQTVEPAVVWSGTHWIFAWVDIRQDFTLYALRKGLDTAPVKVAQSAWEPAFASNGTKTMITWSGSESGTSANAVTEQGIPPSNGGVQKAFIDASGITGVEPVHRDSSYLHQPVMAKLGDTTLVAWTELDYPNSKAVLRVQPVRNGVPQPARSTELSGITGLPVAFESNGSEALLIAVAGPNGDTHVFRIAADGSVLSEERVRGLFPGGTERIAWTGTQWLVVWRQVTGENSVEYRAMRIGANGKVIDATPVILGTANAFTASQPDVAVMNGGTALVVWLQLQTTPAIGGAFVSSDLQVTSLAPITIPSNPRDVDVVSNGNNFLLTRLHDTELGWYVLTPAGVTSSGRMDALQPGYRISELRTFWTGEYYLVISARDPAFGQRALDGARITADGVAIDTALTRMASMKLVSLSAYSWNHPAIVLGANQRVEFSYVDQRDASSLGDSVVFRWLSPAKRRSVR